MLSKISGIYFKLFVYEVSFRRNFIPILSIYFLSLDSTFAHQLGIFTAIGFLFSFLIEIPSGYLADSIGHKKALILSKVTQLLSVSLYVMAAYVSNGNAFYIFILASIFQAFGFSFHSGTFSAFFHEILEEKGEEKLFGKLRGKLSGNVSLVSMIFIIFLPFLTSINIILPIIVRLFIDVIGLISICLIQGPKVLIKQKEKKSISKIISHSIQDRSIYLLLFIGGITGFMMGDHAFRTVYLENMGYPIMFIGFVMGLSRFFWYLFGHCAHKIEKILTMRQLFFYEMILFPIAYLLIVLFDNPYVVGVIFSLIIGYQQGRKPLLEGYLLNKHKLNKDYKATLLSLEGQISSVVSMFIAFGLGFIMNYSFKIGYLTHSVIFFIFLIISFSLIYKNKQFKN